MKDALLTVEGLNALLRHSSRAAGRLVRDGGQSVAVVGRNGMGKTTLCAAIMGIRPRRRAARSASAARSSSAGPHKIAQLGIGYVPQGRRLFPSLSWTSICGWSRAAAAAVDREQGLRAVSAACRAQVERRRAALGRRAADARDRPRAAHEPEAADHGRAIRGACADGHREPDRDVPRASSRRASGSC